jgi:hypothetical protein
MLFHKGLSVLESGKWMTVTGATASLIAFLTSTEPLMIPSLEQHGSTAE